jgi:3-hydroxyisobutyrate dehydrogenase-like beta-hydroxyacid dehydrogenase
MPKMAESDFSVEGTIAIMMKDLEMIRRLASSLEFSMPVVATVAERYEKMIADGRGDSDCSELVTLYRGQN